MYLLLFLVSIPIYFFFLPTLFSFPYFLRNIDQIQNNGHQNKNNLNLTFFFFPWPSYQGTLSIFLSVKRCPAVYQSVINIPSFLSVHRKYSFIYFSVPLFFFFLLSHEIFCLFLCIFALRQILSFFFILLLSIRYSFYFPLFFINTSL